jgi:glycine cleavage system regulatory protein/class 3 adenylate cyclase
MNDSEVDRKRLVKISGIGQDRPGIVYRIASTIRKQGGNILLRSMQVTGEFAIVVVAAFEPGTETPVDALSTHLSNGTFGENFVILIREIKVTSFAPSSEPGIKYSVLVKGEDRMGIVESMTLFLLEHNLNLASMESQVTHVPFEGRKTFNSTFEFSAPEDFDMESFRAAVKEFERNNDLDVSVDHEEGQYRAELFDELINRILLKAYPKVHLLRNAAFAIRRGSTFESVSVDFVLDAPDGEILVETKAPYTNAAADVIGRAIDRLVAASKMTTQYAPVTQLILAIPMELPVRSAQQIEEAGVLLQPIRIDVWAASELRRLALAHLGVVLESFTIAELEPIVGSRKVPTEPRASDSLEKLTLPIGEKKDVVVLSADFCSFSAYVHASGADAKLIASVMGRFYRECRAAIRSFGGVLDKFMGDGVLCYWFTAEPAGLLEACVARLIGIALNIAEEWQDQIDLAVVPRGLRAGAAIGDVLFIEERRDDVHAVGESINVSARLQSAVPESERGGFAPPNCLVIANRLHTRYFAGRDDYTPLGPVLLRNIGNVVAWRKAFIAEPVS